MVATATEADWDAVIAVHLKGTFAVTKHACEYWRAQSKAGNQIDARIVNTVSGAGLWGNVGQSAYGAAKAAIANLTVVTAMEGRRYGVVAQRDLAAGGDADQSRISSAASRATDPALDPARSSEVVAWLQSRGVGVADRPDPARRRPQAQPHRGIHRGAGAVSRRRTVRRFSSPRSARRSAGCSARHHAAWPDRSRLECGT